MASPKHLKNLVAQGKIREALDALPHQNSLALQNDIAQLSGRFKEYERQARNRLLSHAEATAELAQIRHSLLALIDELPSTSVQHRSRRWVIPVVFATAIVVLACITVWNGYGLRNLFSSPNLTAEPREISPDTLPTVPATDKRAAPVTQPQASPSQKNTPPAPAYHIETHDNSSPIIIPNVQNSTIEIRQQ